MKKIIISSLLLVCCLSKADLKIAVVDMNKVVQSTSAGKKANATIVEELNKKKKEIEKKETDLQKMGQEIEKKRSVLSEEAIQNKQSEFQQEMLKYRDFISKSQSDLQKQQQDLTLPILEKIKKAIDKITLEKDYDLVLENTAGIIKFSKRIDITDVVIAEAEKEK